MAQPAGGKIPELLGCCKESNLSWRLKEDVERQVVVEVDVVEKTPQYEASFVAAS